MNWRELLEIISELSEEQLQQEAMVCDHHPMGDYVFPLRPIILVDSVKNAGLTYTRSATDNKHHPEQVIIYTDGNPFGVNGRSSTRVEFDDKGVRTEDDQFPKDHSDECDWTGPAQKIIDSKTEEDEAGGTVFGKLLTHRLRSFIEESK